MSAPRIVGRHRLGMPGGVHCLEHPQVASALAEHRRTWLSTLISNGRHSFAAMRRRTAAPSSWVPAPAG
ncbi:hypothetical protein G4H71_00285 [Rhodococcus triatomae]|uniref:Uncharacterized protein n=1 Tax=Rhodococcus triatomae TaxID=300028 RepID=A0A1G8CLX8_9NOCA|nr:hypothetical protein [Rhodococcus triatomae]QNG18624.1 hypothetical protein G4H72_07765 [Rhodococcus triatomae]QNG21706.1 hypothetical protein G4H71_00285 [Rhodococcus triatomae]SDH46293.1 hypothetical protein SAMN05444695_10257 [Rhodococcus triatomae]